MAWACLAMEDGASAPRDGPPLLLADTVCVKPVKRARMRGFTLKEGRH